MTSQIFISYRRSDARPTQDLYDELLRVYPADDVFMDTQGHIDHGDDFMEKVRTHVSACSVMLVIIGKDWLEQMQNRPEDREDYVLFEVRRALELDKKIVPVLLGDATMPDRSELPAEISRLARLNAHTLRPRQATADGRALVDTVQRIAPPRRRRWPLRVGAAAGLAAAVVALAIWHNGEDSSDVLAKKLKECVETARNVVEMAECEAKFRQRQ